MNRFVNFIAFLIFVTASLTSANSLTAGESLVAIVEDMVGEIDGIQFMDLIEEGQVIQLKSGQSLTLGYLGSCTREVITGGSISIGLESSVVTGGSIKRELVDCDGGDLELSTAQKQSAGAIVFRKAPTKGKKLPKPQRVIYGQSPVIRILGEAPLATITVRLKRLDGKDKQQISIEAINGFADLAKNDLKLEPGGLYQATFENRKIIFRVSPMASATGSALLGRLVVF